MGNRKRDTTLIKLETEENLEGPLKKRKKLSKKDDGVGGGTDIDTADARPKNLMEKKKKRKTLDKERHTCALQISGLEPSKGLLTVHSNDQPSSLHRSILPEFHIGVFKSLTETGISSRVDAVKVLVKELYDVQRAFDQMDNKEVLEDVFRLEAVKADGLNNCAPSVRYAVRRLIRGVSSFRECARQGFALGLTMLLGKVTAIKLDSFLKLISTLLEVSSSMKGQEVKDCLLGHLFAYAAVVRSGRLKQEWIADCDIPHVGEFIRCMVSLSSKKQYLQEPCVSVLLELAEQLPEKGLLCHLLEESLLRDLFCGATSNGNPDALLLALKLQEKISIHMKLGDLLSCPFSADEFFAPDHLSMLLGCFKASAFCQPRVHSLWPVLVNILLPSAVLEQEGSVLNLSSNLKHKKIRSSGSSNFALEETSRNFRSFCECVIDGCFLASSHDRKHLALDVTLLILDRMPVSFLPTIFSSKLIQCLMDVLACKSSWLHKAAQNFLRKLMDWCGDHDGRRTAAITALQRHSNGRFDCISRTKTVKELMCGFKTESGCMMFIQSLACMFLEDNCSLEEPSDQSQTTDDNSELGSVEEKDSYRPLLCNGGSGLIKTWIVDSLPGILKNLNLGKESEFCVQKEVVKFLSVQGLFSASLGSEVTSFDLQEKFQWPKTASCSSLCKICIRHLEVLLCDAHNSIPVDINAPCGPEHPDLGFYFMRFFRSLRSIPSVSFFRTLTSEEEEAIKSLEEMESRLQIEEWNAGLNKFDLGRSRAVRYLLIQMSLQLLAEPGGGEFHEAASELTVIFKKLFGLGDMDLDEAPMLMDVFVDTYLSMLPRSSAPLRSAMAKVFVHFFMGVTEGGLLRMLQVIKRDLKPARHRVVDDGDDEDDDFLEMEDDLEEDGEAIAGESEELGDSEVAGMEDDSDGGMDDEAMFRMDSYLTRFFNERKSQACGEIAQSQLILFKLRVLSLLEIYVREFAGVPQVVVVYAHLSSVLTNPNVIGDHEELAQRIWGILQRQVFRAKRYPTCDNVELSVLVNLLGKNLKLVSRPTKKRSERRSTSWNWQKMANSLGEASIFWILKMISSTPKLSEEDRGKVCRVFREALGNYYFQSKKLQMKSRLLKEIFRRRPWLGCCLLGFIAKECGCAASEFLRVDALALIADILRSVRHSSGDECALSRSNLPSLCRLLLWFAANMPKKQSRCTALKKSCHLISQMAAPLNLTECLLALMPDEAALHLCRAQFGDKFLLV